MMRNTVSILGRPKQMWLQRPVIRVQTLEACVGWGAGAGAGPRSGEPSNVTFARVQPSVKYCDKSHITRKES